VAIASTAEYKVWAGISESTYDSVIAVIIAGVQDEMEKYCGREFDYSSGQEDILDGTGTNWLVLRNAPLYTNTVVLKLIDPATADVLHTYAADEFDVNTQTGIITLGGTVADGWVFDDDGAAPVYTRSGTIPRFPVGTRNITAEYDAGYGTPNTAMPAALKLALYRLVDMQMALRGKDPSLTSENLGQYSYSRGAGSGAALGDYQKMLASYMAPWRRLGGVA